MLLRKRKHVRVAQDVGDQQEDENEQDGTDDYAQRTAAGRQGLNGACQPDGFGVGEAFGAGAFWTRSASKTRSVPTRAAMVWLGPEIMKTQMARKMLRGLATR